MKRLGFLLLAVLAVFSLSGCAGMSTEKITEAIDSTGNIVTRTTESIADTSVKKEESVHKTLRNRDDEIGKAHAKSGMKMTWQAMPEEIFYHGMAAPITVTKYMPVIEYREQARFDQELPTAPSEHPAWKVVNNIGGKIVDGTLFGYAAHELGKTARAGFSSAKTDYNGPYTPITDSYNQTAEPFVYGIPK